MGVPDPWGLAKHRGDYVVMVGGAGLGLGAGSGVEGEGGSARGGSGKFSWGGGDGWLGVGGVSGEEWGCGWLLVLGVV